VKKNGIKSREYQREIIGLKRQRWLSNKNVILVYTKSGKGCSYAPVEYRLSVWFLHIFLTKKNTKSASELYNMMSVVALFRCGLSDEDCGGGWSHYCFATLGHRRTRKVSAHCRWNYDKTFLWNFWKIWSNISSVNAKTALMLDTWLSKFIRMTFYRAVRVHSADDVLSQDVRLSVCLSVCSSHAGIVSKRLNNPQTFFTTR